MARWLVLILLLGTFASFGCQRETKKTSSKVSILVPKSFNKGVGTLSTMPADRKACYGAIILGDDLMTPAVACSPSAGIIAGFVEPGGTISVEVKKGSNRKIELYAFLESAGASDPCPQFLRPLSASQLIATYKMGEALNVDMSADETPIAITADFPGQTNNIAQTLSMPASCTAGSINAPAAEPAGRHLSAGYKFAVEQGQTASTGISAYGRVGVSWSGQASDGSGVKMTVNRANE